MHRDEQEKKDPYLRNPVNKFTTPPSDSSSSFTIIFQSFVSPSSREEADVSVSMRSAGWLTSAPAMPKIVLV